MVDYTLKGSTKFITDFITVINEQVEIYITQSVTTDADKTWISTWNLWIKKGILESRNHNMRSLCTIILDTPMSKLHGQGDILTKILVGMRSSLPIMDKLFIFSRKDNDSNWKMSLTQTTKKTPLKPSSFLKPGGRIVENPYSPQRPTKTTNDDGSTWTVASSKLTTAKLTKLVALPISPPETSKASTNSFDALDIDDDDTDAAPDDSTLPDINQIINTDTVPAIPPTNNPSATTQLTDGEATIIRDAIANGTISSIDKNILCRWIESKSHNISMSANKCTKYSDLLDIQYLAKTSEFDDKITSSIIEATANITNHGNTSIDNLDAHTTALKYEISNHLTNVQDQILKTKRECSKQIEKNSHDIKKSIQIIHDAETTGLTEINTTSNRFIHDINALIQTSQTYIDKIKVSNTLGKEINTETSRLIATTKNTLSDNYEDYYEKITNTSEELLDTYTHKFQAWNKDKVDIIQKESAILQNIATEINNLQESRKYTALCQDKLDTSIIQMSTILHDVRQAQTAIQSDRDSVLQMKLDIKQLLEQHNSNPAPPRTTSFSDLNQQTHTGRTHTQTTPTRGPSDTTTTSHAPPLQPDTAVTYDNGSIKISAFIMDHPVPVFKSGRWHYSLHSMEGQEYHDCPDQFVDIYFDHLESDPTSSRYHHYKHDHQHKRFRSDASYSPTRSPWTSKPLGTNEFIYPLQTAPQSVYADGLYKHGPKWTFGLTGKHKL